MGRNLATVNVTINDFTIGWKNDEFNRHAANGRTSSHAWLDGDADEYGQSRSAVYEACEDCVVSIVTLVTAELTNSETNDDVYITFEGTAGSSEEVIFSHGLPHMDRVIREITHPAIGDMVSVTVGRRFRLCCKTRAPIFAADCRHLHAIVALTAES